MNDAYVLTRAYVLRRRTPGTGENRTVCNSPKAPSMNDAYVLTRAYVLRRRTPGTGGKPNRLQLTESPIDE